MKVQIRNMGGSAVELKTAGPREMLAALGTLLTGQTMIVETPSENEIRIQAVSDSTHLHLVGENDLSADLIERVKRHEGFSSTVYKDSLGYPTIGYVTEWNLSRLSRCQRSMRLISSLRTSNLL